LAIRHTDTQQTVILNNASQQILREITYKFSVHLQIRTAYIKLILCYRHTEGGYNYVIKDNV